jgi:hypothetical protein
MSVFFLKKYNQANSSVVNNMQYNLLTIFLLSGPFAELGFIIPPYNCVKFHLIPMSRLGGVALTRPSLHTERISEYKLNYLPFQIFP